MATSIINTLEGYYTLSYTGAQVQSLLNFVNSLSSDGADEKIDGSFSGIDNSTTATWVYIIAERNDGEEVTTAIPPATTEQAGVMSAADKIKLEGAASKNLLKGSDEGSSAYDYPQLSPSSVTTWSELNNYLNSIGSTTAADETKAGWISFHINGVPIKVLCQVQGYGNQRWSQMVFGQVKLENGALAQDYLYPTILVRYRDNTGWKTWKKINE